MQHEAHMAEIADQLRARGHEVDKPNVVEGHVYEDNLDANAHLKRGFIDEHFAKINSSEAILVVNDSKNDIDGYVGGNTLIEISHAYAQGLDIFLLNDVPNIGYADEIRGMHPVVLHGNLDGIDEYVATLPLVYMSTESALKQRAVGRAMRKAGVSVRIDGKKVASGVNEQPMTFDETYEGAKNRHENLHALKVDADYYVTVESGLHHVHEAHGAYGCTVVIVEPKGSAPRVGFDLDVEFPNEWLAKVPSEYADMGVLVRQKYGIAEKDPTQHLTGGKLTRQDVVERAVFTVAVQLKTEATV